MVIVLLPAPNPGVNVTRTQLHARLVVFIRVYSSNTTVRAAGGRGGRPVQVVDLITSSQSVSARSGAGRSTGRRRAP